MAKTQSTAPRSNRRWTLEEDERLRALVTEGYQGAEIGERLGRSEHSVSQRIFRLRLSRREERPLTCSDVAAIFGVSSMVVVRWVHLGYIRAVMRGPNVPRKRRYYITLDDVYRFMEKREHWGRWSPHGLHNLDAATREWARELREGHDYLTVNEVAERFVTSIGTVRRWVQEGRVAAVEGNLSRGRGRRLMVAEASLRGFVPPNEVTRAGMAIVRFSRDDDLFMLARRVGGASWATIAREIARDESSVAHRVKMLAEQAEIAGSEWLHRHRPELFNRASVK